MKYLFDTDWVVDFLRGRVAVRQLPAPLRSGELAISLITYGEVYDGIDQSADPITAEAGFQRLLRHLAIVPLDEATIRRFFRVRMIYADSARRWKTSISSSLPLLFTTT
jgi:predicted nucleic acid-binding protein